MLGLHGPPSVTCCLFCAPVNMSTPLLPPYELPETIPEAFTAVARQAAERVAMQIKQGDRYQPYTYGELARQVQGLAASLIELGVQPGDRVAILAETRPEWAIVYLSIVTVGAIAVPLDIQMAEEEIALILPDSASRIVFASARTSPLVKYLPPDVRVVNMDFAMEAHQLACDELVAQGLQKERVDVGVKLDDVASLLYTSGTTKRPKGVLLTHRNFVSNAKALMSSGLAGQEDNFLVVLPLHHAYPFMTAFLVPLLLGARMTFLQSLKGPDLLQCLRETQITMLVGVPQVFAMIRRAIFEELGRRPPWVRVMAPTLLALSGLTRQHTGWNMGRTLFAPVHRRFGESLRLLCSGGAKLDPQVAKDLTRLGFTIREGYGLTETSPVVSFTPLVGSKTGSVGRPISNVGVRIVNPDEQGIGEVAVSGPNVMKGYDRDPAATADAIRHGWVHTGDVGSLDRDGYLFLTGRAKELIVTPGGKNIIPDELEAQYQRSQAIAELCLIGIQREGEEGESLHAAVVPNFDYLKAQKIHDGPSYIKNELARIALTLPPYKRIMGVSIITEPLPRTRLGKIQRHLVAALVESGRSRRQQKLVLSKADQELLATETARDVLATLALLLPPRKEINPGDHLDLDLGLDSLKRVELLASLEKQFGPLPESLAAEVVTVRELIEKLNVLEHARPEAAEPHRPWREILEIPPPRAVTKALLAVPGLQDRVATTLAMALMEGAFRIAFGLRVKGQEHVPEQGPFLLAANHLSYLDPFVLLSAVPRSVSARLFALGWEPYFRSSFGTWVARVGHVIPVGRETPMLTVLRASAAVLRAGKGLLVFPEGQRSIDGRLLPFKKGIGVLACELGVPVVPVSIKGSYEAWPTQAKGPRPAKITVRFGNSITVTSAMITQWIANGEDPHEASADLIREAVADLYANGAQA